MKSGYKIDWSDEASTNLDSIIDYLIVNWTSREIRNFFRNLEKKLAVISKTPFAFPSNSSKITIRRCVLSVQTSIYYEVKEDRVIILSLSDNRRDPNTLKF